MLTDDMSTRRGAHRHAMRVGFVILGVAASVLQTGCTEDDCTLTLTCESTARDGGELRTADASPGIAAMGSGGSVADVENTDLGVGAGGDEASPDGRGGSSAEALDDAEAEDGGRSNTDDEDGDDPRDASVVDRPTGSAEAGVGPASDAPNNPTDDGGPGPAASESCTSNDRCSPPAVCDKEDGRCVECLLADHTGCEGATPYCLGATNREARCVACQDTGDCAGDAPVCDADGRCSGCDDAGDCERFAETPQCRDDGQCVACLDDAGCDTDAPICGDDGRCEGCTEPEQCDGYASAPACDPDTGSCVRCVTNLDCNTSLAETRCSNNECTSCVSSADCAHFPSRSVCLPSGQCVPCAQTTDCKSPATSVCADNVCEPCTQDADCTHVVGKPACDDGLCVECLGPLDDECAVAQNDYVCNSRLRRCTSAVTDNLARTRASCEPCLSGEHCEGNQACVYLEDGGTVPFCVPLRTPQCANLPFSVVADRESVDGGFASVCLLPTDTSCAALLQHTGDPAACGDDPECGASGQDDAVCNPDSFCAMRCADDDGCPNGLLCVDETYCEL